MSNAGLTEEDVKVLVVSEFLRDHGFGIDQLSFERTLTLRLGKQRHKRPSATGRLDILVRSIDRRPLLIVEVKAPALPLTDGDGAQAVSYARSIDEDRIPPYAVVTNGRATRIYDVLTRAELSGSSIPRDHPHAKNGFLLSSADELALRAEALECFVGLSSDNLASFCAAQVADRMAALRSDDPRSGRKYVPSLYVERVAATTRLTTLLSAGRVVTLIVAPPQVGKTNFLCRYAERLVEQGEPCIFYTAIGLGDGLLSELADDLGWMARETRTVPALVSKLSRIAERAGKPITLCLDGLNEASDQVVRTIDADCRRLAGVPLLRVVISLSSEAARRLLRDGAGNPSYLATGAGIPATGVELLQVEPHRACESWSVVSLREYNDEEVREAYRKYGETYEVKVPREHRRVPDPFLLRVAMEHFSGQSLPPELDEPQLIESSIQQKIGRSGIPDMTARTLLTALAESACADDVPVDLVRFVQKGVGLSDLPNALFESALLARMSDGNGRPTLDFYSSRERDFLIARARGWFATPPRAFVVKEYGPVGCSRAALNAMRWMLRQAGYLEGALETSLSDYVPAALRTLLLQAAFDRVQLVPSDARQRGDWYERIVREAAEDEDMSVRAEAAKLIAAGSDDTEEVAHAIVEDERFVKSLLEVDDEFPLDADSLGRVVLGAFSELEVLMGAGNTDELSSMGEMLLHVAQGSSRHAGAALKVLAYTSPKAFFAAMEDLPDPRQISLPLPTLERRSGRSWRASDLEAAVSLAVDTLGTMYFGDMCPGYLESLRDDPDGHLAEYEELSRLSRRVLGTLAGTEAALSLESLLRAIRPDDV